MNKELIQGPILGGMLLFSIPMIFGNLLQQCYNIIDTLIVSRFLGPDALAAVGSSFTLMTFLTSIVLGLCMGSGVVFSIRYGQQDEIALRESTYAAFVLISLISIVLSVLSFLFLDGIRDFLRVMDLEIWHMMRSYLAIVFIGIFATFLYNYFACYLRSVGDSFTPLIFLAIAAIVNIVLDLLFVVKLDRGVVGTAEATVIAQYISGIGLGAFVLWRYDTFRPKKGQCKIRLSRIKEIASFSILTCIQQSIMNLGILLVQGLVNSFGDVVMAAFAAAVKIDSFAYLPVQDFGNAFSTFIAQNYGAKQEDRIQEGLKGAIFISILFCVVVSSLVWLFSYNLMQIFVDPGRVDIIQEGVLYLRIVSLFYFGIGCLFLLYGLYRALAKPGMSVVLTIISLGTRVLLAYLLSSIPEIGVPGIWWAIPIGWILADSVGIVYYFKNKKMLLDI